MPLGLFLCSQFEELIEISFKIRVFFIMYLGEKGLKINCQSLLLK